MRCNYSIKIALEGDTASLRDFFKKSGSNFILKDKIFSFSWQRPYSFVAEGNRPINSFNTFFRRGTETDPPASPQNILLKTPAEHCSAGNSAGLNSPTCPDWNEL
ncbi:MAG: hypothetical protein GH147_09510 [Clostridia bacterium]|nr:hypothetical protein [Clostridia bacterium]